MLLFFYYVPESHINEVNQALFQLGLGTIGQYDSCCWSVKGKGQFRPMAGSNPYVGKQDTIEKIDEYKVEIVCPENLKQQAIDVLTQYHPYEKPAYGFIRMLE